MKIAVINEFNLVTLTTYGHPTYYISHTTTSLQIQVVNQPGQTHAEGQGQRLRVNINLKTGCKSARTNMYTRTGAKG